jgi:iron complex transport system substrate-binding protein
MAALLMVFAAMSASAVEITDMVGRKVVLPDKELKAFCASPPALYLLYALDPSLAAGLNFPMNDREKEYLRPDFARLPVLGGWFGQGQTPNLETLLAVKPDFILAWHFTHRSASNDVIEEMAKTLDIPVVYVQLDSLRQYADAFEFLGQALGRAERGAALARETRRILDEVEPIAAAVPEDERVSVYYAQGLDGLRTDCDTSVHAELINLAGGRNIRSCQSKSSFGMEPVSLEEVLLGAPEVILAKEETFFHSVRENPAWSEVRAVREGRVVLIPSRPFNWFDRPPSFMRILGLCWLTNKLYPERYPKDMVAETKTFYRLFLDVELDDEAARAVLGI